jgi:hypothetical protein
MIAAKMEIEGDPTSVGAAAWMHALVPRPPNCVGRRRCGLPGSADPGRWKVRQPVPCGGQWTGQNPCGAGFLASGEQVGRTQDVVFLGHGRETGSRRSDLLVGVGLFSTTHDAAVATLSSGDQ